MDTDSAYAVIRKRFNAFDPLAKPIFSNGLLDFNNSVSYDLPSIGNMVVLDVKPEIAEVSRAVIECVALYW